MTSGARAMGLWAIMGVLLGMGRVGLGELMGTDFTYQGRFTNNGNPAGGSWDFEFRLFDAVTVGTQVGNPITKSNLSVTDGYFTTTLDFGSGIFTGDARWLQIAMRPAGQGSFTTLTPRHKLTPTPYTLYTSVAGTANYLPKFTSSGLANSVIYESNGRIGVGTPLPTTGLHVQTALCDPVYGFVYNTVSFDPAAAAQNAGGGIGFGGNADSPRIFSAIQGIHESSTASNYAGALRFLTRGAGGASLAERVRIASTGRVGIGTTQPDEILTVGTNSPADDGGQTRLRINHAASNVGARVNLVAGNKDNDEPYFAIETRENVAPWNILERMRINHNGYVGIGTIDPKANLDVRGSVNMRDGNGAGVITFGASGNYPNLYIRADDDPSTYEAQTERVFVGSTGYVGIGTVVPAEKLDVNGTVRCVSLIQTSDEQLKTDIQPLGGVLDKLSQVRAVSFQWNGTARSLGAATGVRQIGVLAQELEQVFPELVTTPQTVTADTLLRGYPEEQVTAELRQRLQQDAEWAHYKAVNYSELTAVLLAAVKELQAQNRALEQRIQALENTTK